MSIGTDFSQGSSHSRDPVMSGDRQFLHKVNRKSAAKSALLSVAVLLGLQLSFGAGSADAFPKVEIVTGYTDLAEKLTPLLKDGDSVLLFSSGFQYYSFLSKFPVKLHVVHLIPVPGPLKQEDYASWSSSVPVEVKSSSYESGKIRAQCGNSELLVVTVRQMEIPTGNSVILLDPDYFLLLYENEVRGGIIDLSMKLYKSIVERGAADVPLYLVDPISKPNFPLQWGYAGFLWTEIWRNPAAFRDDLPSKWKIRKESEFLMEFGQFEEATVLLEEARAHFPKDGSIEFQLARLAFLDRDTALGIRCLNRAVRMDRRFLRGYSEFGEYFISKERPAVAEMVLRAGLLQEKGNRLLNFQLFKFLLDRVEERMGQDPEGARKDLGDALELSVPKDTRERALILQQKIPSVPLN